MRTVTFGRTGLEITAVGFGAWAIGGSNWEFGWGKQDDDESVSAIQRALELGINWVDTAAQYGLGHSEEVVRRAVEGVEPRPLIFTKGGQPEGPNRTSYQSLKRDSLRRECEGSLERLGVDAIDLYQIHWPIPDDELEEGWSTLAELKEEGLVRHIGASNFSVGQLERAESISPVEALQPPYSLLDREVEAEILPYCEEHGIGVIVYSPMSSGLLTGRMTRERIASLPDDDWRRQSARFREPELSRCPRARRAGQGRRRAARRLARSGRRRVDAAPPGRPRRDRRVPPPRPGRPDRGRGRPRAERRRRRRDPRRRLTEPPPRVGCTSGDGEARAARGRIRRSRRLVAAGSRAHPHGRLPGGRDRRRTAPCG